MVVYSVHNNKVNIVNASPVWSKYTMYMYVTHKVHIYQTNSWIILHKVWIQALCEQPPNWPSAYPSTINVAHVYIHLYMYIQCYTRVYSLAYVTLCTLVRKWRIMRHSRRGQMKLSYLGKSRKQGTKVEPLLLNNVKINFWSRLSAVSFLVLLYFSCIIDFQSQFSQSTCTSKNYLPTRLRQCDVHVGDPRLSQHTWAPCWVQSVDCADNPKIVVQTLVWK